MTRHAEVGDIAAKGVRGPEGACFVPGGFRTFTGEIRTGVLVGFGYDDDCVLRVSEKQVGTIELIDISESLMPARGSVGGS